MILQYRDYFHSRGEYYGPTSADYTITGSSTLSRGILQVR